MIRGDCLERDDHSFAPMMNGCSENSHRIGRCECTVVDKKPTTATSKIVGEDTVYKTRAEARTAIKTVKVCSEK